HNVDGALRGHRRVCLEYRHVVVWLALQFESFPYRRTLRGGASRGAWQLVGHKMERRRMAKSRCADDYLSIGRFYFRRASDVFAFYHAPSVHAALRPVAFWQAANLQRRLDGA